MDYAKELNRRYNEIKTNCTYEEWQKVSDMYIAALETFMQYLTPEENG